MKFIERTCWAFYACCTLLILHWVAAKLFHRYGWQPSSHGDFATWFGVLGTLATLIGTIWIATSDRRVRDKEKHNLAVITAAGIAMKTASVRRGLEGVLAYLTSDFHRGYGIDREKCANELEFSGMWTTEEIMHLVPLPNGAAVHLSGARSEIQECIRRLRSTKFASNSELDVFLDGVVALLRRTMESVDIARRECADIRLKL